jgi:hypothetical protein
MTRLLLVSSLGYSQHISLLLPLFCTHLSNTPAPSAAPALRFRSDCKVDATHAETLRVIYSCWGRGQRWQTCTAAVLPRLSRQSLLLLLPSALPTHHHRHCPFLLAVLLDKVRCGLSVQCLILDLLTFVAALRRGRWSMKLGDISWVLHCLRLAVLVTLWKA